LYDFGEQESCKAGNVPCSKSTDRKRWTTLHSVKRSVREVLPQGRSNGQPEGAAVKGKTLKRWVENKSTECVSTKKIKMRPTT